MFSVKRQLRDYLKMQEREHSRDEEFAKESGLMGPSGRVVMAAVVMYVDNMHSLILFIIHIFCYVFLINHLLLVEFSEMDVILFSN